MHRHGLTWVAIFAVITMMFLQLPQMAARQDAVHNTYSALVEVDALARQRFVEPIDSKDHLVEGAIRGVLLQLDPYSGYISPKELAAFERRSAGDYTGIGVEIGMWNGRLTVIAPVDGSPAARAGVRAGDQILSIEDRDTEGLSVFDIEELLIGPPDSAVRLRLQHDDDSDAESLTIYRSKVSLVTIRGWRRDQGGQWDHMIDQESHIGYIRISNFLQTTIRDFDEAMSELLSQGMRGLIIDLRFNPGGIMHQAIAMVDRFVDKGLILETVNRRHAVQEHRANPNKSVSDVPLVALINDASASSSEIVAGALQAHGRALVVGERSFGKGSVQHLIYLRDGQGAVKLTTAYYRLPDGRVIHRGEDATEADAWGVIPDVVVPLGDEEVKSIERSRRLLDHTAFIAADAEHVPAGVQLVADHPDEQTDEVLRDRQLEEALRHLADTLNQ